MKLKGSGAWKDQKSPRMKEVTRKRGERREPGAKILEEDGVVSRKLVDEVRRMDRCYNGWNYWGKEIKLK